MSYRLYSPPARSFFSEGWGLGSLREVFFLIAEDGSVLWSDASDSPVRLPDSRARWEAIWSRRDRIVEIAHSHPVGPLAFSREDETTMRALVTALGRPMLFSVVSPHGMVRRHEEIERGIYPSNRVPEGEEPWWAALLRLASGMTKEAGDEMFCEKKKKETPAP